MRNKKLIVLFSILSVITILIVLGSVVFSVQGVYASCYNADDTAMDERIADGQINGIDLGKSIFMINEDEVINAVESQVSEVKVVNIERKFPNRIYINYVRIFPYLALEDGDKVYYASNEGKILSLGDKQSEYGSLVKYIGDAPTGKTEGENLFGADSEEANELNAITDALERIGSHTTVVEMFKLIDTTKTAESGLTYFITRTGTCFELQGGTENMLTKLRLAVSVFAHDETKYMNGGTITVNSSGTKAWFSEDNAYYSA